MRTIYQHFEDHDYVFSVPYDYIKIDGLKTDDKVNFMGNEYIIQDIKIGNDGIHFYLNRTTAHKENKK